MTYILSIEKEIARDLQDDDIINEFAAKDKKTGILFCFKLLTLFTLLIVIIICTYAGRRVTKPRPKNFAVYFVRNNAPPPPPPPSC